MKSSLVTLLLATVAVGCGPDPTSRPVAVEVSVPQAEVPSSPCDSFRWRGAAWRPLDGGTASFRGLSAVSDDIVWVSGTGGTWGHTIDGGETWTMRTVPGAEELDFRDVDAIGNQATYLMSAGPGDASRIYKTVDDGKTWELQHTNPSPEGFYDGMAFWDAERGVLYGDPVDGRFVVLTTTDGGATWNRVPAGGIPPALEGEAGFAASGSGIAVSAGGYAWFGSGGPQARVFHSTDYGQSWTVAETPMLAGEGSAGIFSLAFSDPHSGVVVGGDYTQPEAIAGNSARSQDGGSSWEPVGSSRPSGFRSAVAYAPGLNGQVLITVGTSGSDLSLDGGKTWSPLDTDDSIGGDSYNAIRFSDSECAAWAAGPEGRLARLVEVKPEEQGS